jgi:hypothetical protein
MGRRALRGREEGLCVVSGSEKEPEGREMNGGGNGRESLFAKME